MRGVVCLYAWYAWFDGKGGMCMPPVVCFRGMAVRRLAFG